ncbi:MAG: ABC transporter substrate-binding protein [Chloroflexi bacterium]|nr:ABC transporter substrate-binding protein [Chloroflexota bacterium]
MRRLPQIVITSLTLASLLSVLLFGCAPREAKEIKIGSIAHLTGALSTFGESHRKAVDLAVAQINEKGGLLGSKVVIIHEDDQSDPVVAAAAAHKLIVQDKVVAIIGPIASTMGMAAAPIAEMSKVPMVVTGTSPQITPGKAYVFRSCWTDDFQGPVLASFCREELGAKTAAILYDIGNEYATTVSQLFAKTFEELGGKITTIQTHPSGATDFRAQLTSIKATSPDVFFCPDNYVDINLIAKQANEIGLEAQKIGADAWDSPELDLVSTDGAYYCSHFSMEDPRPETRAFVEAFRNKYGSDPDLLAIMAYDAAQVVFDAIKRAGKLDGESIQKAMAATKGLPGAQGDITFNENGDPISLPAAILRIEGGRVVYVKSYAP